MSEPVFGDIVVNEKRSAGAVVVSVVEAPEYALMSLELIAASNGVVLRVSHEYIDVAGIHYTVIGWDDKAKALQLHRESAPEV